MGGSFCLQNNLADHSKPHHDKDCYLASDDKGITNMKLDSSSIYYSWSKDEWGPLLYTIDGVVPEQQFPKSLKNGSVLVFFFLELVQDVFLSNLKMR